MPRRVVALLLLCLLPVPPAVASHSAAAGADGPDPDGAYSLSFDVHRESAGVARFAFDVARTDADGTIFAARDLGERELPAGTSTQTFAFLPAEGIGHYVVSLRVDDVLGAEVSFDVLDESATTSVTFSVADAPTYLNLTSDTVNADGKVKSPGEALVTRAAVSDANGLVDLDALLWAVERAGATIVDGVLLPPTNVTSWSFEHRFDRSPFAPGNYTLHLRAVKASLVTANASRTFVIREVAPTFVGGNLTSVVPDEPTLQTITALVADRNGALGGSIEARVYRGSARAEGAGFAATLGAPSSLGDVDGATRFAYPLGLRVPAGAANGTYRVSLYHDGSLLGAIPFEVLPLPSLANLLANATGDALRLSVAGAGEGVVVARVSDGEGASVTQSAPFANGSAALTLAPPRRGVSLTWNVTLHARAGGPSVASREGSWTAPAEGPAIALAPLHVGGRLPAAWRVVPAPVDAANASFQFSRWDGLSEPRIVARLEGDRLRVDAPSDLPAGRYTGRLTLAWANGTTSQATWTFDAGPWVELALGPPTVNGAVATLTLTNAGGVAISRVVVETQPQANVTLLRGGDAIAATRSGPRASFPVSLAPGEEATLRVELPPGLRRSGAHEVAVRVLARVELR